MSKLEDMNLDFDLQTDEEELTEEEFSTLEESLNQCRFCDHRGLDGFDED